MARFLKILIVALILFDIGYSGFQINKDSIISLNKLKESINKILSDKNFKKVDLSIKIISADKKDVLFSLNDKAMLPPASTLKILTTSTALSKLNSKFLFKTIIFSDNKPRNGIIEGNLYLKGYGNPLLSYENLESMVQMMKENKITSINGDIVADESYFDDKYKRTDWVDNEEIDEEEPLISSLSLNRNYLSVIIKGGPKKNKKPEVEIISPLSNIKITNNIKTTQISKKNRKNLEMKVIISENSLEVVLSGLIRLNSVRYLSAHIERPALYTAMVLKALLVYHGISVKGSIKNGKMVGIKNEIAKHEISLDSIATITNKHSDNFLADYLLKVLGAELKGTPGHASYGKIIIANFMKENGIDSSECQIFDGSGLSRKNRLTANSLTHLLLNIYNNKKLYNRLLSTLPIAGIDGTLRGRMIDTKAQGNAKAKTGTLNGVCSLAGYVNSADNELLIFSINMNEFRRGINKYRFYQDEIVELLTKFSRKI